MADDDQPSGGRGRGRGAEQGGPRTARPVRRPQQEVDDLLPVMPQVLQQSVSQGVLVCSVCISCFFRPINNSLCHRHRAFQLTVLFLYDSNSTICSFSDALLAAGVQHIWSLLLSPIQEACVLQGRRHPAEGLLSPREEAGPVQRRGAAHVTPGPEQPSRAENYPRGEQASRGGRGRGKASRGGRSARPDNAGLDSRASQGTAAGAPPGRGADLPKPKRAWKLFSAERKV